MSPGPDGSIGPETAGRLAEIGRWLRKHGGALVWAHVAGPIAPGTWGALHAEGRGRSTLHVLKPGAPIRIPAAFRPFEARLGGVALPWKADGDALLLEIPEGLRSPLDTIVTLRPSGAGH